MPPAPEAESYHLRYSIAVIDSYDNNNNTKLLNCCNIEYFMKNIILLKRSNYFFNQIATAKLQ